MLKKSFTNLTKGRKLPIYTNNFRLYFYFSRKLPPWCWEFNWQFNPKKGSELVRGWPRNQLVRTTRGLDADACGLLVTDDSGHTSRPDGGGHGFIYERNYVIVTAQHSPGGLLGCAFFEKGY